MSKMTNMGCDRRKKWERTDEIAWLRFVIEAQEDALEWYIALEEDSIARRKQLLKHYLQQEQQWWDRFLNYCRTGK
jgi:hypothetical protein